MEMLEEIDQSTSVSRLGVCCYRYLQQMAKSLGLPSNVKKVHLIQLIHAKKFETPARLQQLVNQVRAERKQVARARSGRNKKRILQNADISSTSQSPPISFTPKRPNTFIIQYSPEMRSRAPPRASDRVLRSSTILRKPNYRILNLNNSVIGVVKGENIVREKHPRVSMAVKYRPNLLTSAVRSQMVSNVRSVAARRPRTLSGISPLSPPSPRVACRQTDGRVTRINALVQKPRNNDVTIQDLINYNLDTQSLHNDPIRQHYPNMASAQEIVPYSDAVTQTERSKFSVYFHKKIRAEQVRSQKMLVCNVTSRVPVISNVKSITQAKVNKSILRTTANQYAECVKVQDSDCTARNPTSNRISFNDVFAKFNESRIQRNPFETVDVNDNVVGDCDLGEVPLPRIVDAFSKFNDVNYRHLTQPIYVEVSAESEKTAEVAPPLESMYNYRRSWLPPAPPPPPAHTRCVYATDTVPTPMAMPPLSLECVASHERGNHNTESSRLFDGRCTDYDWRDFRCNETLSASPPLANIPEMVEDALEIISQDGDYMERLGAECRVPCVLCAWVGAPLLLDYHVRHEHGSEVLSVRGACEARFPLSTLVSARGATRVLATERGLYALTANVRADLCAVDVAILSSWSDSASGSITLYNRVTGEPFTWAGEVLAPRPDRACLRLPIARLDLLTDIANIGFHRERGASPTKYIEHTALNEVILIVHVRIVD